MTIYEDAQRQVEQWDNHDKFRCCASDRVLWSNGCEPDEVAMAREVIRLTDEVEYWRRKYYEAEENYGRLIERM